MQGFFAGGLRVEPGDRMTHLAAVPMRSNRRWPAITRQHCRCIISTVLCVLASVARADPPPVAEAGHFRGGSVAWTSLGGNTVEFEILSSWRRSHSGNYLRGTPAQGRIFIGDEVTVNGQSAPRILFGDDSFAYLVVKVTDYSELDDWFSGVYRVNHTYVTPNQGWKNETNRYGEIFVTQGNPWDAKFVGCCRIPELRNAPGAEWSLEAPIDLIRSTGMPSLRSKDYFTLPITVQPTPPCPLPGRAFGLLGGCAKLHFTDITCGNQIVRVGTLGDLLVSKAEPAVDRVTMYADGTVQMPCAAGCLTPGLYSMGVAIVQGTVNTVRIESRGEGCTPGTYSLTFTCPVNPLWKALCLDAGGAHAAGTYTVGEDGKVVSVTITSRGRGYLYPPLGTSPQCDSATFEPMLLQTEANVLVRIQERHRCFEPGLPLVERACDPENPIIQYDRYVIPQLSLETFPGVGAGWNALKRATNRPPLFFNPTVRSTVSGVEGQDAAGHIAAYAGYPVRMTFQASANWCQAADGSVTEEHAADPRCSVPDAGVSFSYGPMPPGARFSLVQPDAITDLLITYDNPFSAHRPGHEHAVDRVARDFANHPGAEQAAQMGFERIDANLNSGNGGASVYLWFRRYDPVSNRTDQEAITHINISASSEDEARLAGLGFHMLEGNLNEQAGGSEVHIWYKKASGIVSFEETRPLQPGFELAVTNITVLPEDAPGIPGLPVPRFNTSSPDINAFAAGLQTEDDLWTHLPGNLNDGLQNPLHLHYRRALSNPVSQTVEWTPCACDAGRHAWCVAAQAATSDGMRTTGTMRCVAVDVVPDVLPAFARPTANATILFHMGQERRVPIELDVYNPDKELLLHAGDPMPAGAELDVVYDVQSGCAEGVCQVQARDLVWTPAFNQGGLEQRICFRAENGVVSGCEPQGQADFSERCFHLKVQKCVYAIQYEQHLSEIASLFRTDWITLFSMNPTVKAPDRVLYTGQLINIGHLYSVVPGDTLTAIAGRFGTSVETLLSLNADLEQEQDRIAVGDELCVLPDSCTPDRL